MERPVILANLQKANLSFSLALSLIWTGETFWGTEWWRHSYSWDQRMRGGWVFRQVSIGFHNLPLFMGEKKKWCPRNPYASGIFYLICPACKAWHSVIQPYWLSVFGHYTFSCIHGQIGHKIAANCATRKFQQCNLNPRSFITKQRSLFYLNMRIINVIRQQR